MLRVYIVQFEEHLPGEADYRVLLAAQGRHEWADGGGQAGGVLLTETVRAAGLDRALSDELARWRKPMARHDPARTVLDLAITLALGGDTCSDLAVVRAEPAVFGAVASDPTLSRTITTLAGDADRALAAADLLTPARPDQRALVAAILDTGVTHRGR